MNASPRQNQRTSIGIDGCDPTETGGHDAYRERETDCLVVLLLLELGLRIKSWQKVRLEFADMVVSLRGTPYFTEGSATLASST